MWPTRIDQMNLQSSSGLDALLHGTQEGNASLALLRTLLQIQLPGRYDASAYMCACIARGR